MAPDLSRYSRPPGEEPRYVLGATRTLIAERAYQFSLYAVDVVASDGSSGRHVLAVPVAIGAVSITVGLVLTDEDSRSAEAGDLAGIASLARAVQGGYRHFRTFPANDLGRFVL
ncbi:hypothetical protein LOK46_01360 [Methylobacterium sp. NMS14P]|uniref:hypothetical protein n=1 Tax=Methylobacterium sp. NMS14P TaxID=2894310 RepID=UPI002358699A|nr:hypothetical protein [Methylobacterium sp. NMS14P]WCS25517.1 hypothetical protein LOK46_01360 [Methylobacterium sp. NMS14P]